jgi:hypothetical protein
VLLVTGCPQISRKESSVYSTITRTRATVLHVPDRVRSTSAKLGPVVAMQVHHSCVDPNTIEGCAMTLNGGNSKGLIVKVGSVCNIDCFTIEMLIEGVYLSQQE